MDEEEKKNAASAGPTAETPVSTSTVPAQDAMKPPVRTAEQNLELFRVYPPGAVEVAREAAEITKAGAQQAEEVEKSRVASQDALRAAGVATVAAFERYAAGDGSPASQRAAIFAARTLGDRLAEKYNIEGGVQETIEFDRNGDFHLRFWRKKDGFPLGFDYNQMRDGLQRQGYLDDLDGELKQQLGIEEQKQEVFGRNGKPLSAGEYFSGISGMDAATRRAYSKSIGAANLFFGGDEEAMTHYFETLEEQEKPAIQQVDPFEKFRQEYFAYKAAGEKDWATDALRRYEKDLDPDFVSKIKASLEKDDWGVQQQAAGKDAAGRTGTPEEKNWLDVFQKNYNDAKDPESKKLVVDLFGQFLGEDKVVAYKEQIEREKSAAASGNASGSAKAASNAAAGETSGANGLAEPPVAPARTVRFATATDTSATGETPESNDMDNDSSSVATVASEASDETKGPVARKGTFSESAHSQGFIAPRGSFFDADQMEWDSRSGKYVAKRDAKPWLPPAAGKTVRHFRTDDPRKNGGKEIVHFTIDPRPVAFGENLKKGLIVPVIGGAIDLLKDESIGETAATTAQEMLRRLGHWPKGTAHGGWPSYRMTKEEYDEFMKFVESGEMPPRPKAAQDSGDDSTAET